MKTLYPSVLQRNQVKNIKETICVQTFHSHLTCLILFRSAFLFIRAKCYVNGIWCIWHQRMIVLPASIVHMFNFEMYKWILNLPIATKIINVTATESSMIYSNVLHIFVPAKYWKVKMNNWSDILNKNTQDNNVEKKGRHSMKASERRWFGRISILRKIMWIWLFLFWAK